MKVKTIVLFLAAILITVGITYSIMKRSSDTAPPASEHADEHDHEHEAEKIEIEGIQVTPAVAGEGWNIVSATGKVTVPPDRLVKVSPRIEGKITAAHGTVGNYVRKGQLLAVISSVELAEARAEYRQALSRLNAARKSYERELQIVKLGGISTRPIEEARADNLSSQGDLADAKSELAQAKSQLVREESELAQCRARYERAKELYADKIISKQDLESAETEYKRDLASVEAIKSEINRAESRVEKAQAKLDISKQYLAREEKVYKNKLLDTRALQTIKADIEAAETEVQSAADKIRVLGASPSGSGDTIAITSPISGRIVSRNSNVGEMVSPSDALFTIADLSQVWVEADVYEKDLSRMRKGQSVEIYVDAYPDKVFTGKIDSISDILSQESRTAKVRCIVSNSDGLLKGEMFARISILTAKNGQTVLVPKEAILDDAGEKIAFTPCMECPEDIKAGTNACGAYDKLHVTTGSVRGNKIEVLSGIEPGTLIVTTGAYQLKTALGSGKLEAGCTGH